MRTTDSQGPLSSTGGDDTETEPTPSDTETEPTPSDTEAAVVDWEADSDQSVYEQTLTAITEATTSFAEASEPAEVASTVVSAVGTALGTSVVCVRVYEEADNSLSVAAVGEQAQSLRAEHPGLDFDRTAAGEAFRTGEIVDDAARPTTLATTALSTTGVHVPLGEYGTVSLALPAGCSLDDDVRQCLDRLRSVIETEIERVAVSSAREQAVTARREERDRLATTHEVHTAVRGAVADALAASTPGAAATEAVAALVDCPPFAAARVVEPESAGVEALAVDAGGPTTVERVRDRRESLADSAFVRDVVTTETSERFDAPDPAIRRELTQTEEGADSAGDDEPSSFDSIATPLLGPSGAIGVLLVSLAPGADLDEGAESALESAGEILGHALAGKRAEDLVASDRVVELEFTVTDRSCLAVGISAELGCYCEVERAVPRDDGSVLTYVRVDVADETAAVDAAESLAETVQATAVRATDETVYLEVLRETSAANELLDAGGTARVADATDGEGRLVIDAPLTANLPRIVNRYTDREGARLVSKETVAPPAELTNETRSSDASLTDRQREMLSAAHTSGYYEWPRERTAEEIADSFGISVSTFSEHLRAAHRAVVADYLD
jgi:predicted DNA binding protein